MIYNRRVAQESCGVKIFYATRVDIKFMVYMENRIDVPTTVILQKYGIVIPSKLRLELPHLSPLSRQVLGRNTMW